MATYFNTEAGADAVSYVNKATMWETTSIPYAYAVGGVAFHCRRPLANQLNTVNKKGDVVSVSLRAALSTNTVTEATGAITPQSPGDTKADLTFDTWEDCSIGEVSMATEQSVFDHFSAYAGDQLKALDKSFETELCGHFSSFGNVIASGGTQGLDTALLDSMIDEFPQYDLLPLDDPNMFCFVLPAKGQTRLLQDKNVNDYQITGEAGSGYLKRNIKTYRGIPVVFTTNLTTGGEADTKYGALFHKDALMCGIQARWARGSEKEEALASVEIRAWLWGTDTGKSDWGVYAQISEVA